jgi:predicted enzyme related to lactoylglutathione lyase
MARLDGQYVAAISPQPRAQREARLPPLWNSYVTVESADATLERARQLGAGVHTDAFDVFDSGRMGVIQDPQNAFVLVWEPRNHIGAGIVNAHGALTWNELATPDMDASADFYASLFGWSTVAMEGTEGPYLVVQNADGRANGGIRRAADTEPAYWLVYFGADDLEATVRSVGEHGGRVVLDSTDIGPERRFAVVQDPGGGIFALYAGAFDS